MGTNGMVHTWRDVLQRSDISIGCNLLMTNAIWSWLSTNNMLLAPFRPTSPSTRCSSSAAADLLSTGAGISSMHSANALYCLAAFQSCLLVASFTAV